jgi:SAM-dependent methyltransferase
VTTPAAYHRSRVPARLREYYHDVLRWPAWLNGVRWSAQHRLLGWRPPRPVLVNLGCGKDYREGFVNVDVNLAFRRDIWLDLRNPLPFDDATIDGVFCSHVLEHFPLEETIHIVRECHRALNPGGIFRVSVPDFEPAIRAYQTGDRAFLHGTGRSLGRLFCEHVLDSSNHRLLFDYGFLEEILVDAGFDRVTRRGFREAGSDVSRLLAALDNRPEISVFVEAFKPAETHRPDNHG